MKDEILTYWEMCSRQGISLQRGMNFRRLPAHGVVLMSRRPNAPYQDAFSEDESSLLYEGHDIRRQQNGPDPKSIDQPRYERNGKPTQNGEFAESVDLYNHGSSEPAIIRVYEKLRDGIWTDRGLFLLHDYSLERSGERSVFKFHLRQADFDSSGAHETVTAVPQMSRQIPSWIKQAVFKRDAGKCVLCGSGDNLHFDHELPFSKGGASITPENVRILCARHNLAKSSKIE